MTRFMTKEDRAALKAADRALRRVYVYKARLDAERKWCDEHAGEDPGGRRWKAATMKLYSLLDEAAKAGLDDMRSSLSDILG